MEEGNAWFFMDQHPDVKFRDYTSDDYIPEALKCYQKGLRVLATFLLTDYYDNPAEQYLWEGMQTFHWSFLQCIAACYKKLGNVEECEKYIAEAYHLISVVWKDFEENKEYYMEYFYKYLNKYDLAEYIK
jgi:tetratricopeptide (TPR) repeat protein